MNINTSDLFKIIGKNIQKTRKSKNITQEELAEMANISPSFLGMIERGQRIPSILTLYKLAKSLNISLDTLFEQKQFTTAVKDGGNKYNTSKKDVLLEKICFLLQNKPSQDKLLAIKIIKQIFNKK